MQNTLQYAQQEDQNDPLHHFKSKFYIPQINGKDCIYFTGNSLGLQPKTTKEFIDAELKDWAQLGVEGHVHAKNPWLTYHEMFPVLLKKIIGCKENEVVVMNQLTVNLHLLMVSFYNPTAQRYKIICEAKAFPSDQYALQSQVLFHGYNPTDALVEVQPRKGEQTIRHEDIISAIHTHADSLALVMFGGVNYYSGQLFNIAAITEAAQSVGAVAGFDLAHAAGNVELQLHNWKVDFACWCSYKYLNSGPGGVSGVFIHEKHISDKSIKRFAGWWGTNKADRFKMLPQFDPIPTAEAWQLSNAPIFSMAAHKAALQIFNDAGFEQLLNKGRKLSDFLLFILDDINGRQNHKVIDIITPRNSDEKGCQVSMLMLERGKEIFDTLLHKGIIADWREPNVIRVAPVPLYNTFEDVWTFGNTVKQILQN